MTGIEPQLLKELRKVRSEGRDSTAVPVIIEHVIPVNAPSGTDPGDALVTMESRVAVCSAESSPASLSSACAATFAGPCSPTRCLSR